MATRRIRRTVVEGGRVGKSYDRKATINKYKKWKLVEHDHEPYDYCQRVHASDCSCAPHWGSYDVEQQPWIRPQREFGDRLNALERWLESWVGKSWDQCYSAFCKENDRRTTKGWHLHSHLESMVYGAGFRDIYYGRSYNPRWWVEDGILYQDRYRRYRTAWSKDVEKLVKDNFGDQKLCYAHFVLYWAKTGKILEYQGPDGRWRGRLPEPTRTYKQAGRLSRKLTELYETLPDYWKSNLVVDVV